MKIESKFNKEQKVYVIYADKIQRFTINSVVSQDSNISYILTIRNMTTCKFNEDECFATIQDLCDYYSKLFKDEE